MKNLFIPYELAVIAKEKGFDEPCLGGWWRASTGNQDIFIDGASKQNSHYNSVCAPLYQQIVDWFREKHEIDITIIPDGAGRGILRKYAVSIWINVSGCLMPQIIRNSKGKIAYFKYPNKAYDKAIEEAFKLINA